MDQTMCPRFEAAFEVLGKRWTGLIIRALMGGAKRFSEIADLIPNLSDRMLSERFRELEHAGIVRRTVYPEVPIRIEYTLSEKGRALEPIMDEVQRWADAWLSVTTSESSTGPKAPPPCCESSYGT